MVTQFTGSDLNKIVKEKGIEYRFYDLPMPAKNSLIQYMVYEGSGWGVPCHIITDMVHEDVINWCDENIEKTFFFYNMPTEEIATFFRESDIGFMDDFKSFQAYHEEYVSFGDVLTYSNEERWPSIAGCNEEGILDGWHRMHSYYRNNHQTIPLLA